MALLGASRFPMAVAILLTWFSSFLSPASCLTPTTPLHDISNTDFHALLCLKLHLASNSQAMASWRNDSLQYCSWPGVTCSKRHTSRVVALALESFELHGQIPPCIGNLTFLRSIHLPNNELSGHIPSEIGSLQHLSYLNLSSNNIIGTIPDALSSCSRLQTLDLSSNSIDGEIPSSISKCLDLEDIILHDNELRGAIPESLGALRNLSSLFLANNKLSGNIPSSLGSNSILYVVLTNNSLTGGIPPLLANSSSLQCLDLTNNLLSGEIPPALFNSSSLQFIFLGVNNFSGSIPPLSNISSPLAYLILSQNSLSGSLPPSMEYLSSVVWLILSQNNFHGAIPTTLGKIPFLEQLDLSYNNFSGVVPDSLYNMSELTYLNIAKNNLIGEIPSNIGYTLPWIETLILQGNKLHGIIPTTLTSANNLQMINLRDNAFHGIIPSFGNLTNLRELNLGINQLEAGDWSFLLSLTNCDQLVTLMLDKNILKGNLPSSISDLSSSLQVLVLAGNQISGIIPQHIGHLTNLTLFHIEQNLLTGNLPDTLGNLSNLFVLRVSQNQLSGHIPLSIGNLSQLSELYLEENNFSGPIPETLGDCRKLETLNLSCNSLHGSIPKDLFTLSSLSEGLDLSHNQLSGEIPPEIGSLINLGPLNLSNNLLSGQIPSTIGECVRLESLNLEGNLLHGRIPQSFRNLRGIIVMDLSENNLSGDIPNFFQSFDSMMLLNLSFNNLEGPVPVGGIFQNESEVYLQGNINLCATRQFLELPVCNPKTSKRSTASNILMIVGLTSLSVVMLTCFIVVLMKKRKKEKHVAHPSCNELKKFTYADIVRATNGFSLANLIGSGQYGLVYKGRTESDDEFVAIKVFKLDQMGVPKSFMVECEAFRNTRHQNLLRVITACSTFDTAGHEFRALILDYMVKGNLDSWLHPTLHNRSTRRPLSLGLRVVIAMDIAASMDYLHHHCMPPMAHCDLKLSNVLLDDVMKARVGDFGISKFLHNYASSTVDSSTSLVGPRGSIGYIAPEYGLGSKVSTEGDVYSYGVIILEMLTGKRPTDEMFIDGVSLYTYVESSFPHNISEILDPAMVLGYGYADEEAGQNLEHENTPLAGTMSCIMKLFKLGLLCAAETPKDRPTMQDVYIEVAAINEAFSEVRA